MTATSRDALEDVPEECESVDLEALMPPRPSGVLHPQTSRLARWLAYGVSAVNRSLDRLPTAAFYRWQLARDLEFSDVVVPLEADRMGGRVRIGFVSDLHAGSFLREADLVRAFERLSERGVDAVVLGGDLVNSRPSELAIVCRALRGLHAPLGIFAVPGNHEHFWGPDVPTFFARLAEYGVRPLLNQGERLQSPDGSGSVWLCGVDEWSEGEVDLRAALAGRRPDEPTVLVSHHPDTFHASAALGVDLQLSGHTHGGQVRLFGWIPMRHSALGYLRGLYRRGRSALYVGRGLGATILPIRIGARPEIPVVTVRAKTDQDVSE